MSERDRVTALYLAQEDACDAIAGDLDPSELAPDALALYEKYTR
jgi:hypothetical protein